MPSKNVSNELCQNKSANIYSDKIITVCNAVCFQLCIDLIHILPPVTAELPSLEVCRMPEVHTNRKHGLSFT